MPAIRDPQPVGSETRVNSTTADDQSSPVVTSLVGGGSVIAWDSRFHIGDRDFDIRAQRYAPDGTAVGEELRVNTRNVHSQYGPAVASLADGGFVVSWTDSNRTSYWDTDIVARRYAADGSAAGEEFLVNAATAGRQVSSNVTGLAGGGFLVSWIAEGSAEGPNARLFGPDGNPIGADFRIEGSTATALPDGGFLVSWAAPDQPGSASLDVFARRYAADGSAVAGEFRVNTTTAGSQYGPAVAALADGGFAVAWNGDAAGQPWGHTDIYAQRFRADGTAAGGEVRVSTTAGRKSEPVVAGLDDGGLAVAWAGYEQSVGEAADIYAQRLMANGARGGAEFRVNADAAPNQARPTIAATSDGGFVVAWDSRDPTTSALDVHARRFTLPPPSSVVGVAADGPPGMEGDAGATTLAFTVTLDLAHGAEQSVQWRVAGLRPYPAGGEDFAGGAPLSGTLVFAPGETSKTITVAVAGDAGAEPDESVTVELMDASAGLILGAASATATVFNDDLVAIAGTPGDDVLVRANGQFSFDGLEGRDLVDLRAVGFRSADLAARPDGGLSLAHGADTDAVLRGVEEVRFADGRLVMDENDPSARVARLYEAALDRLPDQGGLNFWIGAVQAGQPLSGLASGFLASPEFQSRFGGATTGNGAFVDRLYLNVLDRAGEADGRAYWVGLLDGAAAGRADVLAAFSESAENKANTAALVRNGIWDRSEAAAEVARLYDTVLGRRPDVPGLVHWKGALESGGATLAQMAEVFTGSAEFQAQYGELDNWDFAEALYRNSLDRSPGYAEMVYWEDVLDAGLSRTAVVLAFSESAEHVALTAGNIGNEDPAAFGIVFA